MGIGVEFIVVVLSVIEVVAAIVAAVVVIVAVVAIIGRPAIGWRRHRGARFRPTWAWCVARVQRRVKVSCRRHGLASKATGQLTI
jgi:hypothetical protein